MGFCVLNTLLNDSVAVDQASGDEVDYNLDQQARELERDVGYRRSHRIDFDEALYAESAWYNVTNVLPECWNSSLWP